MSRLLGVVAAMCEGSKRMDSRPEVGAVPLDRNVLWLNSDELLYRVPPTGIDHTMIEEMAHHQAETTVSRREYQRKNFTHPGFIAGNFLLPPVQRRFEVYAQLNPGAGAIKFNHTKLTYGELDMQADGVAVLLQQNGLGPGDFCALLLEPSIALVRAILGVLKAGGAYLLLDPMLPVEHIAASLCASNPRIVIVQENFSDKITATDAQIIFCNEDATDLPCSWPQEYPTKGLSPAYAISTFSATDSPSFIISAHMALIDRLESMQTFSPIGQGDSVLQNTNDALDVWAWESLWPLSHGAQLVITPRGKEMDPECMLQFIIQERITVMHVVPSLLQPLLTSSRQHELRSLRALFCAGDWPIDIGSGTSYV